MIVSNTVEQRKKIWMTKKNDEEETPASVYIAKSILDSWLWGSSLTKSHGGVRPLEEPKVISAFSGKQAGKHGVHIACGSTYSAAITAHRGPRELRPAGQGSSEDEAIPVLVAGLKGLKVIDVACGSGDAQTLAVTENGT
ncbi:hypothetical protein H8959_014086 [Pygathrix nigripes]